ncbi:MAG: hypothetical protein QXS51_02080 [Thermoproteota archaeon]
MIDKDELLVSAILQEIEDLKVNLSKLNNRVLRLERRYRELSSFLRWLPNEQD